jgi:hypothetical protein
MSYIILRGRWCNITVLNKLTTTFGQYALVEDTACNYIQAYMPNTLLENEDCKVHWDRKVVTDKLTTRNRSDITFENKRTKEVHITATIISKSPNKRTKYNENTIKCTDLKNELRD